MRQVMVVVLCYEVHPIQNAHRLLQARMNRCKSYLRLCESFERFDQFLPGRVQILENIRDRLQIVMGILCNAITQVCRRQNRSMLEKIANTPLIERVQVSQVPQMFLSRPLSIYAGSQSGLVQADHQLPRPHRRAPQAFEQDRKYSERLIKRKFTAYPGNRFNQNDPFESRGKEQTYPWDVVLFSRSARLYARLHS